MHRANITLLPRQCGGYWRRSYADRMPMLRSRRQGADVPAAVAHWVSPYCLAQRRRPGWRAARRAPCADGGEVIAASGGGERPVGAARPRSSAAMYLVQHRLVRRWAAAACAAGRPPCHDRQHPLQIAVQRGAADSSRRRAGRRPGPSAACSRRSRCRGRSRPSWRCCCRTRRRPARPRRWPGSPLPGVGGACAYRDTTYGLLTPLRPRSMIRLATSPVQPVWCDAPSPAPVSPWKYSWNGIRSRHAGSCAQPLGGSEHRPGAVGDRCRTAPISRADSSSATSASVS